MSTFDNQDFLSLSLTLSLSLSLSLTLSLSLSLSLTCDSLAAWRPTPASVHTVWVALADPQSLDSVLHSVAEGHLAGQTNSTVTHWKSPLSTTADVTPLMGSHLLWDRYYNANTKKDKSELLFEEWKQDGSGKGITTITYWQAYFACFIQLVPYRRCQSEHIHSYIIMFHTEDVNQSFNRWLLVCISDLKFKHTCTGQHLCSRWAVNPFTADRLS